MMSINRKNQISTFLVATICTIIIFPNYSSFALNDSKANATNVLKKNEIVSCLHDGGGDVLLSSKQQHGTHNRNDSTLPSCCKIIEKDYDDGDNDEQDDFGENDLSFFKTHPSMKNNNELCEFWAKNGECNANPEYMLRECIPSCLSSTNHSKTNDDKDNIDTDKTKNLHGLLNWAIVPEAIKQKSCKDDFVGGDDVDGSCEDWAKEGECFLNPGFMLRQCAQSCRVCFPLSQGTFEIGPAQEIVESALLNETLDIMIETNKYMTQKVMVPPLSMLQPLQKRNVVEGGDINDSSYDFTPTRKSCYNHHSRCSHNAAAGHCSEDSPHYEEMVLTCSPACQACHLLDYNKRCPPPDVVAGDIGLMFERIVGERDWTEHQMKRVRNASGDDYEEEDDRRLLDMGEWFTEGRKGVTIHSRPLSVNNRGKEPAEEDKSSKKIMPRNGPWVVTIENFLTPEECDRLIELGTSKGYKRSTEVSTDEDGKPIRGYISDKRTSSNAWCNGECAEDAIASDVMEKISLVTGIPLDNQEELQLLKYNVGEYYGRHHDFIKSLPRVLTFFLYLEDVEEGGGTRFVSLDGDFGDAYYDESRYLDVQPKRGMALIWPNVLDEDPRVNDERTFHEALPVVKGVKYGANAWSHMRDVVNRFTFSCA